MAALRQRGKAWVVDFTTPAGERVRRTLGAHSKAEAERELKEIELALGQNQTALVQFPKLYAGTPAAAAPSSS